MALRDYGLYIEEVSVSAINDGGDVSLEVRTYDGAEVAKLPLSIQNGLATLDVPQSTTSQWPDYVRFTLVAAPEGTMETRLSVRNSNGGIDFVRLASLDPPFSIVEAGQTLQSSVKSFSINVSEPIVGAKYDLLWSLDDQLPDFEWNDPFSSIEFTSFPGTFAPFTGLPTNGQTIYLRLRVMVPGGVFETVLTESVTAATAAPPPPTAGDVTVSSFTYASSINSEIQNLFGYANTAGVAAYMSALQAVRPPATKTLITQADFDSLQPGEHGVIPDGTNLGGIYLTSSSGSATEKKWISGGSNAYGVGATTVTDDSFFLFDGGQHYCISNLRTNTPGQYLFYFAEGKHNWIFDNHSIGCRIFMNAEAPGAYGNPGIDDNHFVGNYASGDGDSLSAMFAPKGQYTNINGAINRGFVFAYNKGENFEYILRDQPSWWWTEPYSGDIGGNSGFQQPELTHSQFVGNHCVGGGGGETVTIKSSGWNVQNNLLESANGHFSLRSTMKTVFANNVYIGPRRGFNMTGANDCEIYNNIGINQGFDNESMAFGRASIDNGTPGFPAYAQCRNNKMQYNWFLPAVGATHYVTALVFFNVIDGYPATNNQFNKNFYRTNGLTDTEWEHDSASVPYYPIMSIVMDQSRFDSNNPGSSKADQYPASMTGVLSQTRTAPGTITTGILDINGNPYTVERPSWIGPGGAIVNTVA